MKKLPRWTWILAVLIALCTGLGGATLRAAAQSIMTGPRTPLQAPAVHAPAVQTPGTPAPVTPAPATPAGVTHEDPTVAPDKGQSADNNVSFPVDI